MLRAFKLKIGHFAFNDARVGTVAAEGQAMAHNIAQEAPPQPVMERRGDQLEFGDRGSNEPERLDKAEAVGVEVKGQAGLVHDEAHDKMGQEQGI